MSNEEKFKYNSTSNGNAYFGSVFRSFRAKSTHSLTPNDKTQEPDTSHRSLTPDMV